MNESANSIMSVYSNGSSWVGDTVTIASYPTTSGCIQFGTYQDESNRQEQLAQLLEGTKRMCGSKPVVICNGQSTECKDLTEAQSKAEELAHKHGCDAFILKPIKKVAPKRDVTTTDLE